MKKTRILWVDDEIDLLKSHIIFLSEKGYEVDSVTNGEDAIEKVKDESFDLIFLDEMMSGMGGLETLSHIKELDPNLPVVMVTKNEEESLMHDAIGKKISDYLIKPVVPSQLLMVCKKILDIKQISGEYVAKDYLQDFNEISRRLMEPLDYADWLEVNLKLLNWDLELDEHPDVDLRQTLNEQRKECNQEFSKFVEKNYKNWVNSVDEYDTPTLTPEVIEKHVFPHLEDSEGRRQGGEML